MWPIDRGVDDDFVRAVRDKASDVLLSLFTLVEVEVRSRFRVVHSREGCEGWREDGWRGGKSLALFISERSEFEGGRGTVEGEEEEEGEPLEAGREGRGEVWVSVWELHCGSGGSGAARRVKFWIGELLADRRIYRVECAQTFTEYRYHASFGEGIGII